MSDQNPERNLFDSEQNASGFTAPMPVHDHLNLLVERGRIVKTSRREIIAALISHCDLDEEGLMTLIMGYRRAKASDIPINPSEAS